MTNLMLHVLVTTFRERFFVSVVLTGVLIRKVTFQHKVHFQMIHRHRLEGMFLWEEKNTDSLDLTAQKHKNNLFVLIEKKQQQRQPTL